MFSSSPFKYLIQTSLLLFFSFVCLPAFSVFVQAGDSAVINQPPSRTEILVRGERLFYGLLTPADKKMNCAACHNVRFSDTLNWNPSAAAISEKYLHKSAADLSRVLLNPSGEKMAQVHKGFKFTPDEVSFLKAYMDELTETGLTPDKPVITNRLLFIVASILFILSFTDLIILKRIKKQWIDLLVITFTLFIISYFLAVDAMDLGHSPGYQPDQPVKFSHKIHVSQNGTDCIYCHNYATYSEVAGIPPENVCMNCHLLVRNGRRSGAFEISKIIDHYQSGTPIKWIKVYNLPDHVFFSHAQHAGAGGIKCQVCHGPVENMDRVIIYGKLTMGWCINCHRSTDVKFSENKFYSQYRIMEDRVRRGEVSGVTESDMGGTECGKCHY